MLPHALSPYTFINSIIVSSVDFLQQHARDTSARDKECTHDNQLGYPDMYRMVHVCAAVNEESQLYQKGEDRSGLVLLELEYVLLEYVKRHCQGTQ